jgi:mannose PTS system EIID component
MMKSSVRFVMFLRSFAIQGSWNYRTLIGNGFAFSILPALREIYRDRSELETGVARHTELFNCHPYLVGVALGAVSELEAQHADPQTIERFKSAVRSSLGSIGDSLVWAAWRPACALLGLTVVFAGAPWWAGPLVYLVAYNAGTLALRIWSFRIGFRHAQGVGSVLRRAHLDRVQHVAAGAGAFLLGIVLPLVLANGTGMPVSWPWICAAVIAAVLGLRFGTAARTPILAAGAFVLILGILIGLRL